MPSRKKRKRKHRLVDLQEAPFLQEEGNTENDAEGQGAEAGNRLAGAGGDNSRGCARRGSTLTAIATVASVTAVASIAAVAALVARASVATVAAVSSVATVAALTTGSGARGSRAGAGSRARARSRGARRSSRLGGAIGRAIDGGATAVTGGSATTTHLFQQSKLYGSGFSSVKQPRWFSPHHSIAEHSTPRSAEECVAGTMFFSVAASSSSSSLAEDVHDAKELPPQSMKLFNPKDVVLYQYQACPFCNKVKAFLDYHDIPYKIVEVNPINKKEIKWSDYKKVPILVVDGEQMVDSSDIVDKLFERIHPEISVDSASDGDEERKWRGWVDNHLVHVLSPNIYRTTSEALESFDYITTHGNFSLTERIVAKYAGAAAMYFVAKKLKKKHNITDERAALYEAAETWVDALNGRKYLGGSNPNLADLAVFGVLRPIRHLKSGRDMVEHTHIGEWYTRMESTVGEPSRIMA